MQVVYQRYRSGVRINGRDQWVFGRWFGEDDDDGVKYDDIEGYNEEQE